MNVLIPLLFFIAGSGIFTRDYGISFGFLSLNELIFILGLCVALLTWVRSRIEGAGVSLLKLDRWILVAFAQLLAIATVLVIFDLSTFDARHTLRGAAWVMYTCTFFIGYVTTNHIKSFRQCLRIVAFLLVCVLFLRVPFGLFFEPNRDFLLTYIFPSWMFVVLCFFVFVYFDQLLPSFRTYKYPVCVLLSLGVGLGQRVGIAMMLILAIVLPVVALKQRRIMVYFLILTTLFCAFFFLLKTNPNLVELYDQVGGLIANPDELGRISYFRYWVWSEVWHSYMSSPFTGLGFGRGLDVSSELFTRSFLLRESSATDYVLGPQMIHNSILMILHNGGVLLLCSYVLLNVVLSYRYFYKYKNMCKVYRDSGTFYLIKDLSRTYHLYFLCLFTYHFDCAFNTWFSSGVALSFWYFVGMCFRALELPRDVAQIRRHALFGDRNVSSVLRHPIQKISRVLKKQQICVHYLQV